MNDSDDHTGEQEDGLPLTDEPWQALTEEGRDAAVAGLLLHAVVLLLVGYILVVMIL